MEALEKKREIKASMLANNGGIGRSVDIGARTSDSFS